jgi:hypothetical protein
MATKQYTSDELSDWLEEKALSAQPYVARRNLITSDERSRSSTIIGRMYFFKYDPKGKAYLPKYDKFPMCIPFKMVPNGFIGLNLHYLSVGERTALLASLSRFRNNDRYDESTRFVINYDLLQSTYGIESLSKPCIHRYMFSHCKSRFVEIYSYEYEKAIQLPVEDWVFKR